MVRRKGSPAPSGVAHLKPATEVSAERVAKLRQWHIDQAISDEKPVAIINFTVTASGEVKSRAVLVEEEHAQVLLPAMVEAVKELGGVIEAPAATPADASQGSYLGNRKKLPNYWRQCEMCADEVHVDSLYQLESTVNGAKPANLILLCGSCHHSIGTRLDNQTHHLNLV